MKRKIFYNTCHTCLAGLVLVNGSCVKKEFDTPPVYSMVATWKKSITIAN
jgi:hypothetical protein